jgi:hypothetical protein
MVELPANRKTCLGLIAFCPVNMSDGNYRNALLASSKTRRLGRKDRDLIAFFDNDGRPLLA